MPGRVGTGGTAQRDGMGPARSRTALLLALYRLRPSLGARGTGQRKGPGCGHESCPPVYHCHCWVPPLDPSLLLPESLLKAVTIECCLSLGLSLPLCVRAESGRWSAVFPRLRVLRGLLFEACLAWRGAQTPGKGKAGPWPSECFCWLGRCSRCETGRRAHQSTRPHTLS